VMMAVSVCWMLRRISGAHSRDGLVGEFAVGHIVAGILSFLVISHVSKVPGAPQPAAVVSSLWFGETVLILLVSLSGFVALGSYANVAYICSPAWVSRMHALGLGICVVLAGGFRSYRWLAVLGLIMHLSTLGSRSRVRMTVAEQKGIFQSTIPAFVIGTQAGWDQIRAFTMTVLWKLLVNPVSGLANFILPEELCVYAMEIPIFDLGKGVDLGVAAHFVPPARKGEVPPEDRKPNYFICNIGHIDTAHEGGLNDLQRTMNTVRDCWTEFKQPDVKGLVSNVVCVFPTIDGTTFSKEINLSSWESQEAAHEWYKESKGHQNILAQHTGGHLRTFGNLLASLKPSQEVRHQDRCRRCSRLVESETLGERAPPRCTVCGGKTFRYPFF